MQFIVKKISKTTQEDLIKISFDKSYIKEGAKKHDFLSLKIFYLKPQQATILKQCALALGTDCAVHRHVIDCQVESSQAILSGSVSELLKIAKKLENQPFSLRHLGAEIEKQIMIHTKPYKMPKIMGILNLTQDSFSDGGECLDTNSAIAKGRRLIEEGAQIIDIGAESTNIHSKPTDTEREISLVVPIVAILKREYPNIKLSVDTRNSKTAKAAVLAGADIINDVSGFSWDEEILEIAISSGKKYVLMHSRGTPESMDDLCDYQNVVEDVYKEIREKAIIAIESGLDPGNIIIDPGFGFAKNPEQNLVLLKHIEEFKSLGLPILVGVSRKRFLTPYSLGKSPKERDDATMMSSFYACLKGADIIRVHNVAATKKALNFAAALCL